jgi:predicted HTH transcriptional regulator
MEPFPDVRGLKVFPGMESNTLEFKETFNLSLRPKINATICAFLNAKGGYVVCGVEDKERVIVGLNKTSAEYDVYLRWFDDYYHAKRITDSEGGTLTVGEVEARIVEVTPITHILVVTVRPTPGKTYKTKEGVTFVRLGASVYKYQESSSLDVLEREMEQKILDANRRIANAETSIAIAKGEAKAAKEEARTAKLEATSALQEKNRLAALYDQERAQRGAYGKQLEELRKDVRSIVGAAKGIEERLDLYVAAMEKEILEKKMAAEEGLKRPWWKCW